MPWGPPGDPWEPMGTPWGPMGTHGDKELTHYRGERARRGLKLPRGFQKVDRVELKR